MKHVPVRVKALASGRSSLRRRGGRKDSCRQSYTVQCFLALALHRFVVIKGSRCRYMPYAGPAAVMAQGSRIELLALALPIATLDV